jgi:2-polyprenyl-3-methyl-5-hydroxy-6-metoxy-1,4-benzoquinol methylase
MAEKHFFEQQEFTRSYLLPYFREQIPDFEHLKILEVGCGEAGFLDVVTDLGIDAVGLELEESRAEIARKKNPRLNIQVGDITDENITQSLGKNYDLIIMRDVIEHIPDRQASFTNLHQLLAENGHIYITFPPRFSGFAGHQQNGRTLLRFFPYLHLLPEFVIRFLGKILHEKPAVTEAVIHNYKIGLTISSFNKFVRNKGFKVVKRDLFLFRPIYKIRFGVPTLRFLNIPVLREFLAFGCECLLSKSK